jgi:hypothetical protein
VSVNAADPVLLTVTVCAAVVCPTGSFPKESDDAETVACAAVAVPLNATVCGVAAALSLTLMDAASAPLTDGVNPTEMAHEAEGASVAPQVVVYGNELEAVPLLAIAIPLSVALPGFDSVTTWAVAVDPTGVAANVRTFGESVACAAVPVPLRLTACVTAAAPPELSVSVIVAGRLTAVWGLNPTVRMQFAAGAMELPQVLVMT